jgi:predicted ATP-dependent serine protease
LQPQFPPKHEFARTEYYALNFAGKWRDFFGQPSVNFHCAIHGMAGEGKSTFAIQFANYMAENFGEVVYISGEEGFSKTLKDKFRNNNAASEHLFLADLRTYQDILNEIKPNSFNFIFIDSLDNMRIGAQELKELRKLFINSALITISQSTKDGKMRGSYEIVHDSDIAIGVSNGVAETIKNRFEEKGTKFVIFRSDSDGEMFIRNTIKG